MIYRWRNLARILRYSLQRPYRSFRYLCFVLIFLLLSFSLMLIVRILQALDYVFFPGFTMQKIEKPVYILANPRSGTTFLHRLLAKDSNFVDTRLYQTLFPSVLFYQIVKVLSWVDRKLGRPVYRVLIRPMGRWMFQEWEGLHSTGMDQPEEDEAYWIYPLLTPTLLIFFPFIRQLRDSIFLDEQSDKVRRNAGRYLKRQIQRQLYAHGKTRTLLAKNVAAAGRILTYLEAMPDMRIVHIYRHPYESIASALSMFSHKPWQVLAPAVAGNSPEMHYAAELWCQQYLWLMSLRDKLPADRYVEIAYDELISNPAEVVKRIYDQLGLTMDSGFERILMKENEEMRSYRSDHSYDPGDFGLTEDRIHELLQAAFERYGFPR